MALLPQQSPFIWGANGQQLTPDQVERLRVVSALAARSGADTSPVGHWTQGLARLADAWGGYKGNMRADAQEAAGMASADAALQGNPILSSVLGGDQAGMATPSPVVNALAQQPATTQSMPVTSSPGVSGAFAGAGGLPSSLVQSESGGNWNALNSEGYGGRGQFGEARLADAARAGVIPPGMTGLSYSKAPEAVQQAVETWHVGDVLGDLGQYVGVDPDGAGPIPPMTESSILAVAHLGGKGGAKKFIESGGAYNPSDSNGTSLADYAIRHAGGATMPASGGGYSAQAPNNIIAALAQAQGNPWVAKKYGGVIDALIGQQMQRDNAMYQAQLSRENASFEQQMRQADPMYQAQLQQAQLQLEQARNPVREPIEVGGVLLDPVTYQPIFDSRQASGSEGFTLSPGQQRFDANGQPIAAVPEVTPQPITADERAYWGIPPDDTRPYAMTPEGPKVIGGNGVTVNNTIGGGNDLRKKLSEKEGEQWGTALDAGARAGATMQDLAMLEELSALAPQGPIQGRLAQAFPGMNSAADAMNSIISRVAPTLREPGSGSTSDIEYEGMLKSLPNLRNKPEANRAIIGMMRAKAQIQTERAATVADYQNGLIDEQTARSRMQELANRSIMTPDLKAIIGQTSGSDAQGVPAGVDPADWEFMTPEERALFQ